MVVNIISFAELLKTRGERGVGGEVIKKPNVQADWTDPTLNPTAFPLTQDSGASEPARVSDGESRCQCSCGSQELDPTIPPDPTTDAAGALTRPSDHAVTTRTSGSTSGNHLHKNECQIDGHDSTDSKQKAATYHAHHFSCAACIAAGFGSDNVARCSEGKLLWDVYQPVGESALNQLNTTTEELTA